MSIQFFHQLWGALLISMMISSAISVSHTNASRSNATMNTNMVNYTMTLRSSTELCSSSQNDVNLIEFFSTKQINTLNRL